MPDREQERLDEIVRYAEEGIPVRKVIPLFKVMGDADRVADAVRGVYRTGFIGQGERVEEFEREFSAYTRWPVVAMNSCTSAIQAVLMLLGVGPGSEVITTPMTCVATNAPILALGATIVWADVLTDGTIDPEDVERKITRRTKAIIAVDWTGRPADYKALDRLGVPVIEDAAHGPLIRHETTGKYICYSFGAIKHLTTGDGGAVAAGSSFDQDDLRLIRWYGLDRRSREDFRCAQDIRLPGMKFHMNDINAAIGLANLPDLVPRVLAHQRNARYLYDRLAGHVVMPPWSDASNYWVFPLLVEPEQRDVMKDFLAERGIQASQVHARNDHHSAYRFPSGPLPGVDEFDATQINVPCGWWLSLSDLDKIIDVVKEFLS